MFHLAAAVGVQLILERPLESLETNIVGTDIVLRAAATATPRADRLHVRGLRQERPGPLPRTTTGARVETMSRWFYACSKAIDESLALAY